MRALHVALHAFGTEHAAIERELFPRLESDDLVVSDLELNSTLLAAETAMSSDQLLCGILGFTLPASGRFVVQMRPVTLRKRAFVNRQPCHQVPFSNAIGSSQEIFVCMAGIRPARDWMREMGNPS